MIKKITLSFLKALKQNNNKAWFEMHKKNYDEARTAFIQSVENIIPLLAKIDRAMENLTARECIFRINRDVRFSKDKRPYKHNMSAYFNRAGKKGTGAGYYLHIEPGASFVAAGIWMPLTEELFKIRQEIDYNFKEWKKINDNKNFIAQFVNGIDKNNSLVRPPKGYQVENDAIEFLKLKSFVVSRVFSDADILSVNFEKELCKSFSASKPMIDFINRGLD